MKSEPNGIVIIIIIIIIKYICIAQIQYNIFKCMRFTIQYKIIYKEIIKGTNWKIQSYQCLK